MKKKSYLWTLVALPLFAACSSEDVPQPGSNDDVTAGSDGVYMTVTLNPAGKGGTRSQTNGENSSSDGVEVGTDEENAVKTALIVLTDNNNQYIVSSVVPGTDNKGSITQVAVAGDPLYQTVAKFDKTTLGEYYTTNANNPNIGNVNVYVFCNPTSDLITKVAQVAEGVYSGNWYDMVYPYSTSDGIWNADRGFTMSNVSMAERQIPTTLNEWNKYSSAASAFKLSGQNSPGTEGAIDNLTNRGAVNVHRMAARFDFRDGSQIEGLGNGVEGEAFTYAVVNNVDGDNIVKCKLYAMGLTNMSKTQYYVGRVAPNSDPATIPTLLGAETLDNYVVSTNWQAKYDIIESNFSNYFEFPFFSPSGLVSDKGYGWDWTYCTEVVKGPSDNYGDKSFHVWRYVTENTIPGVSRQVNSQSTGVIFKARMLPTDILKNSSDEFEKELYSALEYANNGEGSSILNQNADTDPILYSLSGNTLYVTWENVQRAALDAAGFDETKSAADQDLDRKAPLYTTCFGTGGYGTITIDGKTFTDDVAEDQTSANYLHQLWETARGIDPDSAGAQTAKSNFKKKATGLGFILYQSSQDPVTGDWGYYCYYYYWNRHNDNLENGVMGRMEFAVVRNNVYKLTVTKLNTLGHPRIPENDPDDPKPDTPDESSEVYISVSVDVVPWVVRLNNIEF